MKNIIVPMDFSDGAFTGLHLDLMRVFHIDRAHIQTLIYLVVSTDRGLK